MKYITKHLVQDILSRLNKSYTHVKYKFVHVSMMALCRTVDIYDGHTVEIGLIGKMIAELCDSEFKKAFILVFVIKIQDF